MTLHAGHDVRYFTSGQGHGKCAGAMAYYTTAGEPAGQWAGKGAAGLGLSGTVDAGVMERLYGEHIGPAGERLQSKREPRDVQEREDAAAAAYLDGHPYASAGELAAVRAQARGKLAHAGVPYWDLTVSASKSVSVLHASLRTGAMAARRSGEDELAESLEAEAAGIEADLMASAMYALDLAERTACYTRTGHAGREWRDAAGFTAGLFLHHLSRDGDPQLHVHVPVLNLVQRADGADGTWRTLDSRSLIRQRAAIDAAAEREMQRRLAARGYALIPREDGNGAEVGGVTQDVMDLFSSRATAITGVMDELADTFRTVHGKNPDQRTLWLMHQEAGQRTRRTKAEARRTIACQTGSAEPDQAARLAAWEQQTARREMQALSSVYPAVRAYAATHRGRVALTGEDRARAARIAVSLTQKRRAAWSLPELKFEIGRALPPGAAPEDINEVAGLAVSGRAGTEVIQIAPAPDVTDVSSLGVRQDGVSIYRPPDEARFATAAHVDLEGHILAEARRKVTPRVTRAEAEAVLDGTDLSAEQKNAVVRLLTTDTAMTVLMAVAGAGKTHVIAAFAKAWITLTGRRVIGITTSQNAAEVMTGEGLAESYNSAAFLGKTMDSDELRHPVPLHEGDVLVLDESSQVSTTDLAALQQAARSAGALLVPAGDLAQLGPVEAGGMLRVLAADLGTIELTEVRRFTASWEAGASVRLHDGDMSVVAVYDTHGRIRGADREAAYSGAVLAYLADHLAGKDALLLAGSNAEAAELARRVQGKLIAMGRTGVPSYDLADGNKAGTDDLIRARLNCTIDAGGRRLTNRDTLKIEAEDGEQVQARRLLRDGGWSARFTIPARYLKASAELDYAGNIHVSEGRTADRGHLLVTPTVTRQGYYVGMTRGRESNTSWAVTGQTSHGKEPSEQATAEAVIAQVMQNDAAELTATEQIRAAREWACGTGHVLNLWSAAANKTLHPDIDAAVKANLTGDEYTRYLREPQRPVLHQALMEQQLAGQDLQAVIAGITAADFTGARSISAVLHGRLENAEAPDRISGTWQARTPQNAPEVGREAAKALDSRAAELGQRLLAAPEPWLTCQLGMPPAVDASPLLREDYARRAGVAASYREAAGITHPGQAVRAGGHRGHPELEAMRRDTLRALEIREEEALLRAATRGELEAGVLDGERARARAPEDVSSQLKMTVQAEADVRGQAADAQARQDEAGARGAGQLAGVLSAERADLEKVHAGYETWAGETAAVREAAGKAKAELARRGITADEPQQTMAGWWREFEAGLEGADRAIGAEHQAAVREGRPWPPERTAEPAPQATAAVKPAPEPDDSPGPASRLEEMNRQARETLTQAEAEYRPQEKAEVEAELEI